MVLGNCYPCLACLGLGALFDAVYFSGTAGKIGWSKSNDRVDTALGEYSVDLDLAAINDKGFRAVEGTYFCGW